ncbi:MAG: ribbon-helix-helix protein, CopG family [Desulfosarcina sp.]|nr:ribbon-helix-helix protein, CopG family [Desulfobacterales bacterium]
MDDKIAKGNGETQSVRIDIPQSLMSRVHNHCTKRNISVQEFIRDALSEKLEMVHKERRKRQRV